MSYILSNNPKGRRPVSTNSIFGSPKTNEEKHANISALLDFWLRPSPKSLVLDSSNPDGIYNQLCSAKDQGQMIIQNLIEEAHFFESVAKFQKYNEKSYEVLYWKTMIGNRSAFIIDVRRI